ncbi:hypothetical protein Pla8534_33290 [Lignipirellula cremea]|uniref:Uncharacterized protein n=1 Tax=Lignipirellula cremea TaxID=2528010 RepID=A0A518DUL0_9BACT|nr:hypothetical protein Pla8534_33290 [Lignipirellula cremea]
MRYSRRMHTLESKAGAVGLPAWRVDGQASRQNPSINAHAIERCVGETARRREKFAPAQRATFRWQRAEREGAAKHAAWRNARGVYRSR